ncbi:MAG TPA: glycosyltransferase family 2 protein [Armatimonadota bacterium]|nr:glycosyltransferase family 2 protein [Armatimonadota bacterium]
MAYAYAVYPLVLAALARLRPRPVQKADITPSVSLIITAHNEAVSIAGKLDNSLFLDYPADRLEVLVASDASTDETESIVARYAGQGVRLVRSPHRVGKTAAQTMAIAQAKGDVVVLSDASALLARDALGAIVRPFADPQVGLVSGEDVSVISISHPAAQGENLYVRYDMWVRRLETAVGSMVGASGCFYAVRRSLRAQVGAELIEDFAVPLSVVLSGKRVVSEPAARALIPTTLSARAEFRRRVRIQIGGAVALWKHRRLLNPFRFPQVAWALISHKMARWLTPLWWAVVLVTSLALARVHLIYAGFGFLQGVFYCLALAGWLRSARPRSPAWVSVPFSLTLANAAMAVGLVQALLGRRAAAWQPSERAGPRRYRTRGYPSE